METTKGHHIRCGTCAPGHATSAEVLECHLRRAEEQAEAEAEYAAMQREEAYWENGGPHAEIIAWENDQDRLRSWV